MEQFTQPIVGKQIEIVVENPQTGPTGYNRPKNHTFTGTVAVRERWLNDKQFAVTSGLDDRYRFPVRVISLDRVLKMKYVEGTVVAKEEVKPDNSIEESVEGSKGNVYVVKKHDGKWSCTCQGFLFRGGNCKHVKAMKEKHNG